MWLLALARQLAVKRRMTREHGAAKTGDAFQEITHIGSSFWPDVGLGGLSLIRRVAEAICSQMHNKGHSESKRRGSQNIASQHFLIEK
ncbi:hypothetical protein A4U53_005260 (plasmid) [Rhizobium ruizarguesonis]|uniref:Uncharacterized protein n=1 Tax=Rhizobium ruizarguesonis TaxID=2081791 RepID=A0ACD5EIK6_9HYPH